MKEAPRSHLVLRRRTPWEAMDAGLVLWRTNAAQVLLPNLIVALALALILRLAFADLRWIPWLLPLVLRPLIDHVVVHVLAVREFNPAARGRALWRGAGRSVFAGLIGDLLWRRLDWRRGITIPLRMLERVKGKAFRSRRKSLARGGASWAGLNLFIWVGIEAGLILGMASCILGIIGIARADLLTNGWDHFSLFLITIEPLLLGLYIAQAILVETLMAAGGFALYLNARVETEGWDLRFAFDSLVQARQKGRNRATKSILPVLFLAFAGVLVPSAPLSSIEAPLQSLEEVLDSRDFGKGEPGWTIELKHKGERDLDMEGLEILEPWLERAKTWSAIMLRILVVLAIAGLLVRLILWWWPRRGGLSPKRAARALKAGSFGKKEEKLARDLLKEAEIAAAAGDTRRALSALRELAPLILAQHWGRTVPANATEQDCIAVARQVLAGTHPTLSGPDDTAIQGVTATTRRADDAGGSGFLEGFEAIMRAWVRLAWAHREVEGRTLEEGLLWSRHWSMGGTHGS